MPFSIRLFKYMYKLYSLLILIDCLLPMADVVFIGKDFARMHGFHNKEEAARGFRPKCQQR